MNNILLENNFTATQLAAMPPKTRALAQQDEILKQLFNQYRSRIASFLTHQDNARHVSTAELNREVATWKNTQNDIHGGGNPPVTAADVTAADRRDFLNSPDHPQRSRGTYPEGKSPIVVSVKRDTATVDSRGEPATYRYNIEIATQKNGVAPDPKVWKKVLVSNYIERDLKHVFGEENVTNFDLENRRYNTVVTGSPVQYFRTIVWFRLPAVDQRIVLGPVGAASDIAKKIKTLARISGTSYHDVLNKLRASFDLPLVESLTDMFKTKVKKQPPCVIACNLTEVSEQPMYMTEESGWTSNIGEAYTTTFEEAEELLASMMFAGRIHTGIVVKIR